jgi:hypothetical protein
MSTAPRKSARNQTLPPSEQKLLKDISSDLPQLKARCYCLYQAGWTLSAIGEPLNRARSTVRSWVLSGPYPEQSDIPQPVDKTYVRKRPVSPGISPENMRRLKALAPMARKYRARFPENHSATIANTSLSALTQELHSQGVSIQELADATGVTYRAMYRRVKNVR